MTELELAEQLETHGIDREDVERVLMVRKMFKGKIIEVGLVEWRKNVNSKTSR